MMSEDIFRQRIPNDWPIKLFWRASFQGWLHQLWARMTRRCTCLIDLDEILEQATVQSSHYVGLKTVDIRHIRGTQGKVEDFDVDFHPISDRTRSRWLSIALEKLRGRDLPPVELVQVDGIYYVRDGHHRISVSHSLGQQFIDAEVTVMMLNNHMNMR
jgi:uncharacterized ParB-like nuclease family protein